MNQVNEIQVRGPARIDTDEMADMFRRAAKILVTSATSRRYANSRAAIEAPAVLDPPHPTSRDGAQPHILLLGPFSGDDDLFAMGIYVGIGMIEIRNVGTMATYAFMPLDGDGIEARMTYLTTAFGLYFDDVKLGTRGSG